MIADPHRPRHGISPTPLLSTAARWIRTPSLRRAPRHQDLAADDGAVRHVPLRVVPHVGGDDPVVVKRPAGNCGVGPVRLMDSTSEVPRCAWCGPGGGVDGLDLGLLLKGSSATVSPVPSGYSLGFLLPMTAPVPPLPAASPGLIAVAVDGYGGQGTRFSPRGLSRPRGRSSVILTADTVSSTVFPRDDASRSSARPSSIRGGGLPPCRSR